MKKFFSLLVAFLAILSFTQSAYAAIPIPKPTGFVNDYANALSPTFRTSEEKKLSDYQKKTTNEIAVVMVNTTGDNAIEDYAQAIGDQWHPGVTGKDNGIIILFAMQDHHDRIATGCGLESAISDIDAQHILDNDTQPLMKAGKYDQAVDTTVTNVINKIGNQQPEGCTIAQKQKLEAARAATANNGGGSSSDAAGIGFLIFFIILIIVILIIVAASSDDDGGGGFGLGMLAGGIANTIGDSDSGGGFGGFSGGSFSGGGASGSW